MNIKNFLDITLNAGCEIGQRTNFITLKKEYTIIYQDKIIAFAHWYDLEKKIWVSFNTIYLKWYQNTIFNGYVHPKCCWPIKTPKMAKNYNRGVKMNTDKFFEKLNSHRHFNTSISNAAKMMGLKIDGYSVVIANYYESFRKNWRTSKAWLSYLSEVSK